MDNRIEFHVTKTQRGAPAIQIGTDLYRIQKHNKNGSIRFTCTNERCNATVTFLENKIQAIRGVHQHGERVLPFHIGEIVNEFRQAVVADIITPLPQLYDRVAKEFRREYGTAAEMPMFQQLRSTAYRSRATALPPYPKSADIRTFQIPDAFRLNLSNEPFLIHDSSDPYRIIAFASKTSLNYLASCSSIHSDGTFKTAPRYFHQSYTIHGWCAETGMKAVCYAATEKRKLSTYITLFRSLKEAVRTIGINLSPSSHMMDFETAAATASKMIFHDIKISFCHFHLAQSIWRKLQKKNLLSQVREKHIRKYIADLIALPLVPTHLVRQRFDLISAQLRSEDVAFKSFIFYFRRTYINSSRFPISSWNHFDLLGIQPRTNNHVEGTHRQLKTRHPTKPNIWIWIKSIQESDESTTIAIEQEEHQHRQTRPRHRRNIQRDEDLFNLKSKFEKRLIDINEYCLQLRYFSYSYLKILDK